MQEYKVEWSLDAQDDLDSDKVMIYAPDTLVHFLFSFYLLGERLIYCSSKKALISHLSRFDKAMSSETFIL